MEDKYIKESPYYMLITLSIISPFLYKTTHLRLIINMFDSISKIYSADYNFMYVCSNYNTIDNNMIDDDNLKYTCGRFLLYDENLKLYMLCKQNQHMMMMYYPMI